MTSVVICFEVIVILLALNPFHVWTVISEGDGFTITDTLVIYAGSVAAILSAIMWRHADVNTTKLGINAMRNMTPILSLVWLALFSTINVPSPDLLVIGALAVFSTDILIDFQAEKQMGFKSLVLALWACGGIVYLRDRIAGDFRWLTVEPHYYGLLTLTATVFILILSFRRSRLAERTNNEAEVGLSLTSKLEDLVTKGVLPKDVFEDLHTIDTTSQMEDLEHAYTSIRSKLLKEAASAHISELIRELNLLTYSKQQGRHYMELAVLYIFSLITVGITLTTRPDAVAWSGFLIDMFAMLFSSAVVFMTFTIVDQGADRAFPILDNRSLAVQFKHIRSGARSSTLQRRVAVGIAAAIATTYSGMLYLKWIYPL